MRQIISFLSRESFPSTLNSNSSVQADTFSDPPVSKFQHIKTLRQKCRCCNLIPENRTKGGQREAGLPWIKAENPVRSRATECHILVVERRRKEEAEEDKRRMLKEEEEEGREGGEGGQTQETAENPPVWFQSASEGRSVSVCWERRERTRRRRWWLWALSLSIPASVSLGGGTKMESTGEKCQLGGRKGWRQSRRWKKERFELVYRQELTLLNTRKQMMHRIFNDLNVNGELIEDG